MRNAAYIVPYMSWSRVYECKRLNLNVYYIMRLFIVYTFNITLTKHTLIKLPRPSPRIKH